MKTEFVRWGNSLALRVPSTFVKELGVSEGKAVEMTVENSALVVRPIRKPRSRRRYRLQDLLAGMTKDNMPARIEWGPPRGSEVW
jgi:antitoxin MazE